MTAPAELEQYILLLLSDSNLPTGGFISSSGLESYIQHGFLHSPTFSQSTTSKSQGLLNYIQSSLNNYSRLNLPFLTETHLLFSSPSSPLPLPQEGGGSSKGRERIEERLKEIDDLFEVMCLNEVTRKASVAQGIALLTLYERAFSSLENDSVEGGGEKGKEDRELVDRLRSSIRKGEMKGHLPIGFGILTALLGVSLQSAQHLFLFLHARSILSSAVRLNTIGPYISHRLLLHDVRPLVEVQFRECQGMRLENLGSGSGEEGGRETPASTWPLGEILAGRHKVLHSKIFNS